MKIENLTPFAYVPPRNVTSPDDCVFYHTMELPGFGVMPGSWDLRGREDLYLGHVQFRGRRVLDAGCASGFLTFHIEKQGAEVVSYDLCEDYSWDVVPLLDANYQQFQKDHKELIRKINNAYWLAHRAYTSKARVAYGTIYNVPREIGLVDISVLGCILEHVRDPFLALQNVLRLTKDMVIITEILPKPTLPRRILNGLRLPFELLDVFRGPCARFMPDSRKSLQGVWWLLWPKMVEHMIGVLGFEEVTVTYHWQKYYGRYWRIYTIVARRTRDHYVY